MGLVFFFVSFSADTGAQQWAPLLAGAQGVFSCIQTDCGASPAAFGRLRAGGEGGRGGREEVSQHGGSVRQRVRGTRDGRRRRRLHRQATRYKEHLGEF